MNDGPARTMFATKVLELSDLFSHKFRSQRYGKIKPRRVLVQDLDAETTGGGKQAQRSVFLVPEDQDQTGREVLVCGWLDAGKQLARMRDYETASQVYQAHVKHGLDLPSSEYERFLDEARAFCEENKVQFEVFSEKIEVKRPVSVSGARPAATAQPPADPMRTSRALLGAVFLAGLLAGWAVSALTR